MGTAIASSGIVLEALNKENYENWSTLVKNYLVGKNIWQGIVEADLNKPDSENDSNWRSKNAKALHAIQLACGSENLSNIRRFEKAREAWNHLKVSFSKDVKAYPDIEQGGTDHNTYKLHSDVKRGYWNDAKSYINESPDSIFSTTPSMGRTVLHVAVASGQETIVNELVILGNQRLLKIQDKRGYTALALAAESTDNTKMAEKMVLKGGKELLTIKTKGSDDGDEDRGEIPVLLAAAKGHKQMTNFLFSHTPIDFFFQTQNDCYYGVMLLTRCISAQIFDIAALLLQHRRNRESPLTDKRNGLQPIQALAHMPSTFPSGTHLGWWHQFIYNCKFLQQIKRVIQTSILRKFPGSEKLYEMKKKHYLVLEILKCLSKRVSSLNEQELRECSAYDTMLQAAKYGMIEFINSMRHANPDLLWAMDKNKRGIFSHAILNRQEKVFQLIHEIEGRKEMIASREDVYGNNMLHLAAELGPSSDLARTSNAALQSAKKPKMPMARSLGNYSPKTMRSC